MFTNFDEHSMFIRFLCGLGKSAVVVVVCGTLRTCLLLHVRPGPTQVVPHYLQRLDLAEKSSGHKHSSLFFAAPTMKKSFITLKLGSASSEIFSRTKISETELHCPGIFIGYIL
jgi:hypothetical protein